MDPSLILKRQTYIEINKLFFTLAHSILRIKFKFKSQLRFLLQIEGPIIFQTERSNIKIDSIILDNIISKIINTYKKGLEPTMEPYRTPVLIGYSSKDPQSITTLCFLLSRNEENVT